MQRSLTRPADGRIAYLDGLRAGAIFLVAAFHFWQQSWLQNVIPNDIFSFLGVRDFSLTWVLRTGYMLVDVLILLSGFCLLLPYLRRSEDSLPRYYVKRISRILPCYYLILIIFLVFFIRPSDYVNSSAFWRDTLSHFTFTHVFRPETHLGTRFPTVLWTLAVEVQFYLIFPFVARLFRRFPLFTWACMVLLSEGYIRVFALLPDGGADIMHINQLPAFFGVYANGMLAATLFHKLRQTVRPCGRLRALSSIVALFCLLALGSILRDALSTAEVVQRTQVQVRFVFSVFVAVLILALDHAYPAVRFVFGNRVTVFLAAISFNFYLWHTSVALLFKEWRIPLYPDAPEGAHAWPQSAGSEAWHHTWQLQYTALIWIVGLLLASLLTFFVEKPLAKRILRLCTRKKESIAAK